MVEKKLNKLVWLVLPFANSGDKRQRQSIGACSLNVDRVKYACRFSQTVRNTQKHTGWNTEAETEASKRTRVKVKAKK